MRYIAGASGTGTSTRALELQRAWSSHADARPCIVLATDVIRAQLRTALAASDAPDLFGESFNLPHAPGDEVVDDVSLTAFERQCSPVVRAVDAGVAYALTEGWNVIVEGVHLVPGMLDMPATDAVDVTYELLVVVDSAEHLRRLRSRDAASDGRRPFAHYERNLDRIHAVQRHLAARFDAWQDDAADLGVTILGG